MKRPSVFTYLPVEIHQSLARFILELHATHQPLAALCRLSRREYSIYTPFLYEKVDQDALKTLSTSQSERPTQIVLHPASFVKELKLEYVVDENLQSDNDDAKRASIKAFRKSTTMAMKNLIFYRLADKPILRKFSFICEFSTLPEALGNTDLTMFELREIVINCEFPASSFSKCIKPLTKLCGTELLSLDIDLAVGFDNSIPERVARLKPRAPAMLFQHLAHACPRLSSLKLDIPRLASAQNPLGFFLDTLHFPALQSFYINYEGRLLSIADAPLDWTNFISKHRSIQRLQFNSQNTTKFPTQAASKLSLPLLHSFSGSLDQCCSLPCDTIHPRLTTLQINVGGSIIPLLEDWQRMAHALKNVPTLRKLVITRDSGYSNVSWQGLEKPEEIWCLVEACPAQLTDLECILFVPSLASSSICNIIPQYLQQLERLKINLRKYWDRDDESMYTPISEASSVGSPLHCNKVLKAELEAVNQSNLAELLPSLKAIDLEVHQWVVIMQGMRILHRKIVEVAFSLGSEKTEGGNDIYAQKQDPSVTVTDYD